MVSFFTAAMRRVFFLPNLDEMKRRPGDQNTKLIGKLVPPAHKFPTNHELSFQMPTKCELSFTLSTHGSFISYRTNKLELYLYFPNNCELPITVLDSKLL
jgi:hypothetical protein